MSHSQHHTVDWEWERGQSEITICKYLVDFKLADHTLICQSAKLNFLPIFLAIQYFLNIIYKIPGYCYFSSQLVLIQ